MQLGHLKVKVDIELIVETGKQISDGYAKSLAENQPSADGRGRGVMGDGWSLGGFVCELYKRMVA